MTTTQHLWRYSNLKHLDLLFLRLPFLLTDTAIFFQVGHLGCDNHAVQTGPFIFGLEYEETQQVNQ